LAVVIDRYIKESKAPVTGTKAQVLKSIKNSDLGETKCSGLTSQRLVSYARDLTKTVEPQACGNYFSYLSNIFTVSRPAWGYPRSRQEFDDAVTVIKKLGLIRKGNERNRRPMLEELDLLMEHFGRIQALANGRPRSTISTSQVFLNEVAVSFCSAKTRYALVVLVGNAVVSVPQQRAAVLLRISNLNTDTCHVRLVPMTISGG
jgi:hypothetical protein